MAMVILKRISSGQLTATHFHAAGAAEGMHTHFPDRTGGIRDLRGTAAGRFVKADHCVCAVEISALA
jgi:hypothetical protein